MNGTNANGRTMKMIRCVLSVTGVSSAEASWLAT